MATKNGAKTSPSSGNSSALQHLRMRGQTIYWGELQAQSQGS